jgi:hypothetical protein
LLRRDEEARRLLAFIFERATSERFAVPVTIVAGAHDLANKLAQDGDLVSAAMLYEKSVPVIEAMSGGNASGHLWMVLSDLAALYEKADLPREEQATLNRMAVLVQDDRDERCRFLLRLTSAALRVGSPLEAQTTLDEAWGCLGGDEMEWISWVSFQFSRLNRPGPAQAVVDRALKEPTLTKAGKAALLHARAIAYLVELDPCQAASNVRGELALLGKTAEPHKIKSALSLRDHARQSCRGQRRVVRGGRKLRTDPAALSAAREDLTQAEKMYASDSQSVLGRRFNLALELLKSGRSDDACKELTATAVAFAARTLLYATELSRASQLSGHRGFTSHLTDALISSCLPVSGDALAEPLLYLKGHVLEGVRQEAQLIRLEGRPGDREIALRLREVRAQIASALLAPEGAQRSVPALTERKEELERQLNVHGSVSWMEPLGVIGGVTGMRRSLNADEAYVEFASYEPLLSSSRERRLIALVLTRNSVTALDLGSLKRIMSMRDAWLSEISDWNGAGSVALSRLNRALFRPIVSLLPDGVSNLIVSPDEHLDGVPWQHPELVGGATTVWLVSSARDFVRWKVAAVPRSDSSGRMTVFKEIDFNAGAGALVGPSLRLLRLPDERREPLSKLAGLSVKIVSGPDATLSRLGQELGTAEMVHIETHGVFLDSRNGFSMLERNLFSASALALTGANRKDTFGRRPGVVSAEVLVGLAGPELRVATLAMCESARGSAIPGQGTLGFVTALNASGTPVVVASAWRASLESARVLFPGFYSGLSSVGPRRAFDDAIAGVRRDGKLRGARHWAAWMFFGYTRESASPTLEMSRIAYRLCGCRERDCGWSDEVEMDKLKKVLQAPGLVKEDEDTIVGLIGSLKQCQPASSEEK